MVHLPHAKEISVQETTGLLWGTWFKFVAVTKDADTTNKPSVPTKIFSNSGTRLIMKDGVEYIEHPSYKGGLTIRTECPK